METPNVQKLIKMCPRCARTFKNERTVDVCPDCGSALEIPNTRPQLGEIIADKYELQCLLGEGGMGYVFKARHLFMERADAVKLLKQRFAIDPGLLKRFQREAKAASALTHPNIIVIHDFGLTRDGRPYMAMDYLEGRGLDELMGSDQPLDLNKSIEIFKQVCDGLAFAHDKGVLHRDLKPSNIFIVDAPSGAVVVKILDFGLAKMMIQDHGDELKLTGDGEIPGTPSYMSPEQCQNWELDARSDIYSLGCIMYEVFTGQRPVGGANVCAIMQAHLHSQPKAFPLSLSLPASLEAIVFKALAKDRNDRYQSALELRRELDTVSPSDSTSGSRHIAASADHSQSDQDAARKQLPSLMLGYGIEWLMEKWLACTGKLLRVEEYPWLAGPKGQTTIGPGIAGEIAQQTGLELVLSGQNAGLIKDLAEFAGPEFDPEAVDPLVRDFFIRTGHYQIEAWSEWKGLPKPIVQGLVASLARYMDQLNLPLSPLETISGIKNEVVSYCQKSTGEHVLTGWIRTLRATGKIMVAGFFATCSLPNRPGRYLKSILPMPGGSYTSISSARNDAGGGVRFITDGKKFGEPRYYRLHYVNQDLMRVGLSPFTQEIHAFVDANKVLRYEVSVFLCGMKFLTFYYKMIRG